MKKIQLFNAPSIATLQMEINEWLADNKDAHIIESNITSLSNVSILGSDDTQAQYAFYILYSPADESEEESILAAAKQQMPSELIDPRNIIAEIN